MNVLYTYTIPRRELQYVQFKYPSQKQTESTVRRCPGSGPPSAMILNNLVFGFAEKDSVANRLLNSYSKRSLAHACFLRSRSLTVLKVNSTGFR